MSMYRDKTTGEVKSKIQLKMESRMSLPTVWNGSVLEALNVEPVTQLDMPDYDYKTEKVELNSVAEMVRGEWVQGWTVTTMTAEEKAAKDAESAEAARQHRDALLQESDWVTVKAVDQNAQDNLGIQVPQVWLDYRQALRDITDQDGWPYNVTWPDKP